MAVCIAHISVLSTPFPGTNGSNDTKDMHNEHEIQPLVDWADYDDHKVWVIARKMIKELLEEKHKEMSQHKSEDTPGSPGTLAAEEEQKEAAPDTEEISPPGPPAKGDDGFVLEKLHADLLLKRKVEYIEKHGLHLAADPSYNPLGSDTIQGTSNDTGTQDMNMDTAEEGLRTLSASPNQEEIDNWLDDMKRHRAMQVKDGIRVSPIHCPIPTCGKYQRRPQALRDHLYFHFDIKPHRCDYGCPLSFETEANKNRHLETCPMIRNLYYDQNGEL
ncbi:unnamed protein product [Rhizoctonia solani]|uniref:C2H2-type domain-containing protein n=1 Tax=Rhizoctonia solani TaxID=456999 RepID=A0A8H3HAE8_9AGAM|nr:unnamed protein product [Rhizoctonia solani]